MDIFEEYLNKKDTSKWVQRALTDKSYKKYYQKQNHIKFEGLVNTDLATYGDGVIKLGYLEIFLDKEKYLTIAKSKKESDKFFVDVIGKHYKIIDYIDFDRNDEKLPTDYNYEVHQSKNKNTSKYIATAVEAMVGAIYKETGYFKDIVKLLEDWKSLKIND